MLRQLTIQLRKRQLIDNCGNPVYYAGPNPLSLTAVAGSISNPWNDFTDYVQGLQDIELEWSAERTDDGRASVGNYSTTKGVSGQIIFEREAYEFLKDYLVLDVAAPLNQVEVQITDTNCGRYVGYFIKSDSLEWCEFNSVCTFTLNLKQIEDFTHCIKRTLIADNWQGWFQNEPLGGKKHPRFGYCIEKRPNWSLVLQWQLTALVASILTIVYTILYPILLIIYVLVTAINVIIDVINLIIAAVNTLPGVSIDTIPHIEMDPPSTPGEYVSSWATTMIEAAGCGREHPAPLIRDYILNACNKCGIQVDATTADIFFAPIITMTHSDGALHTLPNVDYNACYLFADRKRGVRRFRNINLIDGNLYPDTTTYFQPENGPTDTLDKFLDRLGKHYKAQWRIVSEIDSTTGLWTPYLYFKRKDWFVNNPPLYDFSIGGADRSKIVGGICYEQGEIALPAYASYLYSDDPADKCGTESNPYYNGTQYVTFGATVQNPIYNGELDNRSGFTSTRFNCDGITRNYIYDALQVVATGAITPINPIINVIISELTTQINRYTDYKILLQTETMSMPKILIWDGDTDNPTDPYYLNATAVRDKINIAGTVYTIGHTPIDGTVPSIGKPLMNTLYPTYVPYASAPFGCVPVIPSGVPSAQQWDEVHDVETGTTGRWPATPSPAGVYTVTNIVGSNILSTAAILVNYPQYYEPHFLETMWDRYSWIDDPARWPRLNKTWSVQIPLCCDDIKKLNLTENVNAQKLLYPVLLDTAFYNVGIITNIRVVYQTGEDNGTGQYIELKGVV